MANWTDEWNVRYGRPRGSIELPVHESFDVKAWAKEIAKGVLPPDAPRKTVKELATALAEATLDSRRRDPISASFFCPDPALGELARFEVISYQPDEQYPEITLQMMADWLSSPTEQSLQPAEVSYTDLPIGPAVRVRHQYVADKDGPANTEGLGTIVQTCAYAARPPEIGSVVLLMVSWRAPAYSDRLFELTDTIAGKLRLERK
jgi:hypothetical protein